MAKELSWRDAAILVLQDAQEPMSAQEIVQQIVERKVKTILGATPWATVGAQIYTSIKAEAAASPFILPEKGRFALRTKNGSPIPGATLSDLAKVGPDEGKFEVNGVVNALGMFWERSKIDWNGPQTKVLGTQSGGKSVDFGPQRGIYLLHDTQGVVYVGRANPGPLGQRLWQHTFDRLSGRWSRFSWFGIYPAREDGTLETDALPQLNSIESIIVMMEALLIEALEPRQNRKRGDTNFEDIEFLQFEDPKFELKRKYAVLEELKSGIKVG